MSARAIGALLAALAPLGCGEPSPEPPRPNVLLVTLDTVRADFLSCYGYRPATTPTMDALADEGARFELCIATAGLTPVSHASILTGLNPYRHGLRVMDAGSGYRLPDDVPTLATILRAEGWSTGAFVSAFPVSERFGLHRGFDTFDNGLDGEVRMRSLPNGDTQWEGSKHQRASQETTDRALGWLRSVDGPFLLWIHYWDPHDTHLLPPDDVLQRFQDELPPPESFGSPEERKLEMRRLAYAAELHWVDTQLGRLVQSLREDGRWENTLLVLTSDHGEAFGEHGWFHHKLLYQEQIHVPLILRLPGGPGGVVVRDLVRATDVLPTVLEAAGLPVGDVDGRSLQGLVSGEEEAPRRAYADALNQWDSNARMRETRPDAMLLHVWMDREWKLIHHRDRPDESELYHLADDPLELENLYAARPDVVERLVRELRVLDPFEDEGFGQPTGDPEVTNALGELGYADSPDDPEAREER